MDNILFKLVLSEEVVRNEIIKSLDSKSGIIISYLNAHCYYVYKHDKEFKKILDNNFLLYPDGTFIWLILKIMGLKYSRFNATDLNFKLIDICIQRELKFLFIGGNFTEEFLQQSFQVRKLNLVGYINGYIDVNKIIEKTMYLSPEIVMIGTGVPKQEIIAHKLSKIHPFSIIICVGNFLNFYLGFQQRAPKFLQKIGMEWFFRFLLEPKRLFYRYFIEPWFFIVDYFRNRK